MARLSPERFTAGKELWAGLERPARAKAALAKEVEVAVALGHDPLQPLGMHHLVVGIPQRDRWQLVGQDLLHLDQVRAPPGLDLRRRPGLSSRLRQQRIRSEERRVG